MNHKSVDFEQLTPMMQHYIQTKDANPDCILFYRLGDFYEMFFEDAEIVSKELELTLTGKSCGLEERAPMCGVPYHAAETYLTRLVQRGYKVAVCEQIEDPKEAKGMVKRAVTRIVTPGTNMDAMSLDESKNNYIMGIFFDGDKYGLSIADVTTADFFVTEVDSNRSCLDEINKYVPSEIICNENFTISGIDIADLKERMQISIAKLDAQYFDDRLAGTFPHQSAVCPWSGRVSYGKYFCRRFDEVPDRDPEVILGTVQPCAALSQWQFYALGFFDQTQSGIGRDLAGKAKKRFPALGLG